MNCLLQNMGSSSTDTENRALQSSNRAFHPSVISTTFSVSDRKTQEGNKKTVLSKAVLLQNEISPVQKLDKAILRVSITVPIKGIQAPDHSIWQVSTSLTCRRNIPLMLLHSFIE